LKHSVYRRLHDNAPAHKIKVQIFLAKENKRGDMLNHPPTRLQQNFSVSKIKTEIEKVAELM
jgi:hypothetical protein